jgi:hypothetical protein
LAELPGVYQYDEEGGDPQLVLEGRIGRGEVDPGITEREARLARHWDRVAEIVVGAAAPLPARLYRPLLRGLNRLASLSGELAERTAECRRLEASRAEAEESRRCDAEEIAGLSATVEEQRAAAAELRRCLGDLREHEREERDRLEGELRARPASSARPRSRASVDVRSRLADSERRLAELEAMLQTIRRSRTWRLASGLQRLYRSLVPRSR